MIFIVFNNDHCRCNSSGTLKLVMDIGEKPGTQKNSELFTLLEYPETGIRYRGELVRIDS
jgi:hypothetical protein